MNLFQILNIMAKCTGGDFPFIIKDIIMAYNIKYKSHNYDTLSHNYVMKS